MGKKDLNQLLATAGPDDAPGAPLPGDDIEPRQASPHGTGLLDPIMAGFDHEQRFEFLSRIVEFLGDYLVNIIDHHHLDMSKVENALSVLQGTVMNQISTVRNQVSLARQQGLFAVQKPPSFPVPGQLPVPVQDGEPVKRKEATEKDVMDIAASIRQLVSRQKGAKPAARPATEPSPGVPAPLPATGELSINSKVAQYQQSSQAQKSRVESLVKPTAVKATAAVSPSKPARAAVPKDLLPDGFHDELMKNIKSLIKDKDKGT